MPSILPGDTGGGSNLAGKRRLKEIFQKSTKPCTILRKGAHFRNQWLETSGNRPITHQPEKWEGEGRLEIRPIRWLPVPLGAWKPGVSSPVTTFGQCVSSGEGGGGGAATNCCCPVSREEREREGQYRE